MSMTKEELFDIFREYASKEFENTPQNDSEIDYEFSDKFNKKMQKLLEKVEYNQTHSISKPARNIIILIAAIIMLFAGLMSVGAIREPFVEMVLEKYEEFIDVFFEGNKAGRINHIYSLPSLPKGFVEIQRISNDGVHFVKYENRQDGTVIEFSQRITDGTSVSFDNKHGHIEVFNVNGNEVNIYISDYGDVYYAFWTQDLYFMSLAYYNSSITIEDIINTIKMIY